VTTFYTGVNAADHFTKWVSESFQLLPQFSLLPFEDAAGQQITSTLQLVDEKHFCSTYFHNHRVLQHSNLTGMIHFQVGVPWGYLKKPSGAYFSWLHKNEVFINCMKFKADTLVPCGFLVGAHPAFFCRDKAEDELTCSLDLDDTPVPFQLSSRTISVPMVEGNPQKFTLQAIIVKTSTSHAGTLRERFYNLENPATAVLNYPYTGGDQFVPMIKFKEWPIQKKIQLAKIHVSIIADLRPIYLENLADIHSKVHDSGESILQGFYQHAQGMELTYITPSTI
jgi:hypothetical protein